MLVEFALLNAFANGSFAVLGPTVDQGIARRPRANGALSTAAGDRPGARRRARAALPPGAADLAASLAHDPARRDAVALLALATPTLLIALAGGCGGIGVEVFGVLWDTSLQQHVPPDRLSRVSSYDALGSFALMPIGLILVGPIAHAIGLKAELLGVAGLIAALSVAVVCVPSVRNLRRVAT